MTSSPGTGAERPPWWDRLTSNRWLHWLLLAAIVAVFMRGWWNDRLPASPRMEMIVEFTVAWLMKQAFAAGHLPAAWNHLEFGGFAWTRFLAVPVYAVMALLSLASGWSLETWLKILAFIGFAGSGIALYEYARVVTGKWSAALVAGLIYAVLPHHLHTAVDWWEYIAFWALLPLPFLFYELALRSTKRRVLNLGITALTLGLYVSVSPERASVSALWFGLYAVIREGMLLVRRQSHVKESLLRLLAVAGIAAGLTAYVVIPATVELGSVGVYHMRGTESVVTPTMLRDYSASPQLLLAALLRRVHIPVDTAGLPNIWSSFGSLNAWYLGWSVLALSVLGLWQARKTWFVWVAVLLGGAALWMSFGPTVPFNPFSHLPLLSTLFPFRGLMLVALFGSVLAGLGVVTLAGWLKRVPPAALVGIAVVVVALDFSPSSQAFLSTERYFSPDEVSGYQWLAQQGGVWRFWEPTDLLRPRYTRSYSLALAPIPRYAGHWVEGLPIRTWEMLDWGDEGTDLRLLGVRYAAIRSDEPNRDAWLTRLQGYGFTVEAWRSSDMVILENPNYLTYATLREPGMVAFGDDRTLLKAIPGLAEKGLPVVSLDKLQGSLDALALPYPYFWAEGMDTQALVQAQMALPSAHAIGAGNVEGLPEGTQATGGVSWYRVSPTTIRIDASPASDALLTVRDSWYPNWRVTVDGERATVLRVDYMLMGVNLSAGAHTVVFEYVSPWYDWLGLGLTALALIALISWQGTAVVRSKRTHAG